jgi:lactobin A/cerein 7B family class IIb bacteriocin
MQNLQELSIEEMKSIEGGAVPPVLVAVACIGGAFICGLAVGALAAWAVYKLTR